MADAGQQVPSLAQSRDRLDQLIDDAWMNGEPTVFPLFDDTPLRGMSIYANVDHAVRLTRAVLALADRGLYLELVPLVRMTLECAVTASWYAVTPHSGDSALQEATRQKRALVKAVSLASSDSFDEALVQLDADLEELDAFKSEEARQFEQRCLSLEGGAWLYVIYRGLSAFSHAGALLLDHYLQPAPGTTLGFEYVSESDAGRAQSDLATQVYLLHIALSAWELVVPHEGRADVLASVAEAAGFASGIRRAERPRARRGRGGPAPGERST